MFKSIRIGRLWGIDVFIHTTFLMFLLYYGYKEWSFSKQIGLSEWDAFNAACNEIVKLSGFFLCVLLHEYGHALTARDFGIGTKDITLYPIGGVARLEHLNNPRQELIIAIAGPAVNVAIVLVLLLIFGVSQFMNWDALSSDAPNRIWRFMKFGEFVNTLFWGNVFMIIFNMLPSFPMDGGRVLRSLLAMKMSRVTATNIAATLGKIFAIGFAIWGYWVGNYLLFVTAFFVWMGAEAEARNVRAQANPRPPEPTTPPIP